MRAEPVLVPLEPSTWQIDFDRLRAAITPRTRALIINSPGNPCGKVFTQAWSWKPSPPWQSNTTCSC